MFTKITTPTNPLRIENILHPYKHGKKPFTPELAKQILTSTNYPRSIRDMLNLIAALPASEQARYKDLVIATFDHREQPNDITIIAKKLAIANNYEDELNQTINHDPTTDNKDGIIYAPAINEVAGYICADKRPDLSKYPPNISLYCISREISLLGNDFAKVKLIKFKADSKVDLSHSKYLPENLDVSMCNSISLSYTDLSTIKNLNFKEESNVNLRESKNLPEDLDVSMCNKVSLGYVKLSQIKSLKFKEGSIIDLMMSQNLPEDLDISMCDEVNLSFTNLSTVKNLKFKEGSIVDLHGCINLPENLDISSCSKVDLSYTDISKVKTLTFKEGSTVNLSNCEKLPENLDISKCNTVNLYSANISNVKTLTFKNKTQQKESWLEIPKDWQGKIVYTEEMPTNSTFRFQTSNTR